MDYSTLVSKLSNNEALLAGVAKYIDSDSVLNLTTADWETRLKNNVTYQDFCTDSKSLWKTPYENEVCRFEESKRSNFNVVVIGYCKFIKPYKGKDVKPGIIVMDCEPLNKIARAMTSDLSPVIKLSNEFKFNFIECSRLACHHCNKIAKLFSKYGYNINRVNQPCISDTKVFDGKLVVGRFSSQMQNSLSSTFVAVMFLQINNRYSYIDFNKERDHRIGGNVLNIIGFNASKLTLTEEIDVGPLVKHDVTEESSNKTDFFTELMSKGPTENDGAFKGSTLTEKMNVGPLDAEKSSDKADFLIESKESTNDDEPPNKKLKVFMEDALRKDQTDFLSDILSDSINEIPPTPYTVQEDSAPTDSEELLKLI